MDQSDIIEAPQVNLTNLSFDERWRQEYAAFIRLLPELLKTNRDKFVAVHAGAVVAVADTSVDAAIKAYKLVGYVPLHVGKVAENPLRSTRVPSPRVRRSAVPI